MGLNKYPKKKYLVVNADDFGMSRGISRGIIYAHAHGIVTSTSLMVAMPAASYAAKLSREYPRLSIGLHGVLFPGYGLQYYLKELELQYNHFFKLLGNKPAHFDLHGAIAITPQMYFAGRCFIEKHGLPYRGMNGSNVINAYYGMKKRKSVSGDISIAALSSVITGLRDGLNILVCHPGFTSPRLRDPYRTLRNIETQVLTSEGALALIRKEDISLVSFKEGVNLYESY